MRGGYLSADSANNDNFDAYLVNECLDFGDITCSRSRSVNVLFFKIFWMEYSGFFVADGV